MNKGAADENMYINPYEPILYTKGSWLKANFHVHSSTGGKGGHIAPSEVVKVYKEAGYDILTLSNHSQLTDTRELGEKHDILTINGIEYIGYDGILCVGIDSFISGTPQEVIDECSSQDGFSVLCHPNLQYEKGMIPTLPRELIRKLKGFSGIEILTPLVFSRFKGSGLAVDLWDELLSSGKLVWAFGSDDFHRYSDMDRAWTMVFSQSRTADAVKAAVRKGCLYASTGLYLYSFTMDSDKLSITAGYKQEQPEAVRYSFYGLNGRPLYETVGRDGVYRIEGGEPYIRVRAMSEHGAALWTQPVCDEAFFQHGLRK